MDVETTISQGIRTTDDKTQYDAACKRLLSEKIILAWIMKSCVQEFSNIDVKEIAEKYIQGTPQVAEVPVAPDEVNPSLISGTGVEDSSVNEGTVTYDIRFFAVAPVSGEMIRLILNVEAQNDFYPGYPLIKRALYYCSRMISSQYGTEFTDSHYEKIKKVYSIWICLNPPKNRQNTITRYYIAEDNLIGNVKEQIQNYDLLTAIMICLGDSEGGNYTGILKLLDVLLSSDTSQEDKRQILQNDFDIPMTQTIERTVSLMCNLSKGVEDKGIAIGTERTILESIRNLMETLKLTSEQAMAALKVPESEQEKYVSMLNR